MSDYMFMLESHLNTEQNRVVAEVQAAAAAANCKVFLTGGAMRDMLGGFPIRDLDFAVDGNALKLAKSVCDRLHGEIVEQDENRKTVEMRLPGGITASVGMTRAEKFPKPGGKPQVKPATIQEDLRRRDFTVNAIALSLNSGSRGLLLDPTNGLADIEHRELRALSSTSFYDDPIRLFRLIRFKSRLGFAVDSRTQLQYENARLEQMEQYAGARDLFEELRNIAEEPDAAHIVAALEQEKLLEIISPALSGAKLNMPALQRLERAAHSMDPGPGASHLGPFLYALTEKLSPKEKAALVKRLEMRKPEIDLFQKLELRSKKLEQALKSARIKKPSHVYQILSKAERDEILFLLYHSQVKPVQERVKSYYQKYLPMAQEFPPDEAAKIQAQPGTPKYDKELEQRVLEFLDKRPKRVAPPPEPPPLPPVQAAGRGRRAG